MRSPSAAASAPTCPSVPRPKRTRGACTVQALLGERPALHDLERIRLDFEELAVRSLEVERVLDPVGAEVLGPALVQLVANAVELFARHRDGDVMHPPDRLPGRRHRIFREIEEGEQVPMTEVMEEMRRALQVAVLE